MRINNNIKICYIIGHREAEPTRTRNLLLVTEWLVKIKSMLTDIDLHIVVIEQDTESKIKDLLHNEVEYIWLNNDGYYNRGWAFNVGFREYIDCDYFFFADNDIVMNDNDIIHVFNKCVNYDAINPYYNIYDSTINIQKNIVEEYTNDKISIKSLTNQDYVSGTRKHTCFSGGIMGINKESMLILSGWDERFRGRGYEDYAFTAKLNLFIPNKKTFNLSALHIYHPYEVNTTREINMKLDYEYVNYNFTDYVLLLLSNNDYGYKNLYANDDRLNNKIKKIKKLKYLICREFYYNKLLRRVKCVHMCCEPQQIIKIFYYNLCGLHDCFKHCPTKECFDLDNCESGD